MTQPDRPAAGVHLPWARVPAAVQAWAAGARRRAPPAPCATWPAVSRPGATTRSRVARIGAVFVKAVGSRAQPRLARACTGARPWCRLRCRRSARLPAAARHLRRRRLGGAGLRGGRRTAAPLTPGMASELRRGGRRARRPCTTSSPRQPGADAGAAGRLRALASSAAGPSWPPWTGRPPGLDPWARAHLDRLAELESGWPAACAGPTLVHGDVRSDNVLLDERRRRLRGLAPRRRREPGLRPRRLGALGGAGGRARRPRTLLARLRAVAVASTPTAVTVLLAAVSGLLRRRTRSQPAPPGLPTLRAVPGRAGRGGPGLVAPPDGVVTTRRRARRR